MIPQSDAQKQDCGTGYDWRERLSVITFQEDLQKALTALTRPASVFTVLFV